MAKKSHTAKRSAQKHPEKSPFVDALSEMLTSSLRDRQDFIITFEANDEDSNREVHVMTGKLINPCMLNTLKNRVSLYSDEGARVMTRKWDS